MSEKRASNHPLVIPLGSEVQMPRMFRQLSGLPRRIWFDSAKPGNDLGRYSFLAADPGVWFSANLGDAAQILAALSAQLKRFPLETVAGLPPFQGGAAGYVSYDLNRLYERIPEPRSDEFQLPVLSLGIYDVVLAQEHATGQTWLFSTGFPEQNPLARFELAQRRAEEFLRRLRNDPSDTKPRPPGRSISRERLAQMFECSGVPGVFSDFSREGFLSAIAQAIEYIHAGDIFQVNLSQRLIKPATCSAETLYLNLRETNPAPLAGFFEFDQGSIVSASPERLIRVQDRRIETRPIKGTRHRSGQPHLDMVTGDELRHCPKDRAENVMIVDLLRNDLSRICQADSVEVAALCELESYQTVQHLVSTIHGRLKDDVELADILRAVFPGGSITGAPKIRAMEIIREIEPTARGPYCGSLGYIGFDGSIDWNILIRTIIAAGGWWQFPVGGGIVADSDPLREYEETWHKASGLLPAVLQQ